MVKKREEILEFVQEREKPEGGFGATPRLPATVEDTYFAVRTLRELSALRENILKRLRAFLKGKPPGPSTQPVVLQRWLWLAAKAGLRPPEGVKDLLAAFLRRIHPHSLKPLVLSALYESARFLKIPVGEDLPKVACTLRPRTLSDLYHLSRVAPELLTQ
ncbi:MAG: hypothetical protein DSZ24_01655, partial [Thermodesulfatator sp.]